MDFSHFWGSEFCIIQDLQGITDYASQQRDTVMAVLVIRPLGVTVRRCKEEVRGERDLGKGLRLATSGFTAWINLLPS